MKKSHTHNVLKITYIKHMYRNKVDWFDWFAKRYKWRNSGWQSVKHSVVASANWGSRQTQNEIPLHEQYNVSEHTWQMMQLWSDWYTMIVARKMVLHTHSDFSQSAVHWMDKEVSKVIQGTKVAMREDDLREDWLNVVGNGGKGVEVGDRMVLVSDEHWKSAEGKYDTPALIDRTVDNLMHCSEEELDQIRKLRSEQTIETNVNG